MTDAIKERTALVTGAGSGLGRAIAEALADHGARVILVGRSEARLRAAAEAIPAGAGTRTAHCDVADPDSVASLSVALGDEDISILVNNAGIAGPVDSLVSIEPLDWDEVFAVNVRGVYLMCRAFLPAMLRRRRGDVINLASVTGKRPLARRTPYCASKMAVIGLSAALAAEVGPCGVNVNSLSPGPVEGERIRHVLTLEAERTGISYQEAERAFVSRAALGRMLKAEEVGSAVVAMLSMPGLCATDIDLSAGMTAR